jgi:hypothetical protein
MSIAWACKGIVITKNCSFFSCFSHVTKVHLVRSRTLALWMRIINSLEVIMFKFNEGPRSLECSLLWQQHGCKL